MLEETILNHLPKNTFTLPNFAYNIQMPRSLVHWNLFSLANKKINENLTSLITILSTIAKSGSFLGVLTLDCKIPSYVMFSP